MITADKKLLNQKGQAIFELILFLPFLMFLYTIYYTIGNSISGSINQQKAVRGYFYNLVKGNSYLLNSGDVKSFGSKGFKRIGFASVGWANDLVSEQPIAPCFKFSSILKNGATEECESSEREEGDKSRFIRLFTYYGVCGPAYTQSTTDSNEFDLYPGNQAHAGSCFIQN